MAATAVSAASPGALPKAGLAFALRSDGSGCEAWHSRTRMHRHASRFARRTRVPQSSLTLDAPAPRITATPQSFYNFKSARSP